MKTQSSHWHLTVWWSQVKAGFPSNTDVATAAKCSFSMTEIMTAPPTFFGFGSSTNATISNIHCKQYRGLGARWRQRSVPGHRGTAQLVATRVMTWSLRVCSPSFAQDTANRAINWTQKRYLNPKRTKWKYSGLYINRYIDGCQWTTNRQLTNPRNTKRARLHVSQSTAKHPSPRHSFTATLLFQGFLFG